MKLFQKESFALELEDAVEKLIEQPNTASLDLRIAAKEVLAECKCDKCQNALCSCDEKEDAENSGESEIEQLMWKHFGFDKSDAQDDDERPKGVKAKLPCPREACVLHAGHEGSCQSWAEYAKRNKQEYYATKERDLEAFEKFLATLDPDEAEHLGLELIEELKNAKNDKNADPEYLDILRYKVNAVKRFFGDMVNLDKFDEEKAGIEQREKLEFDDENFAIDKSIPFEQDSYWEDES